MTVIANNSIVPSLAGSETCPASLNEKRCKRLSKRGEINYYVYILIIYR